MEKELHPPPALLQTTNSFGTLRAQAQQPCPLWVVLEEFSHQVITSDEKTPRPVQE